MKPFQIFQTDDQPITSNFTVVSYFTPIMQHLRRMNKILSGTMPGPIELRELIEDLGMEGI